MAWFKVSPEALWVGSTLTSSAVLVDDVPCLLHLLLCFRLTFFTFTKVPVGAEFAITMIGIIMDDIIFGSMVSQFCQGDVND